MEASIVELRYKTKEILKALDQNEAVKIMYHGKEKGLILPVNKTTKKKVEETGFFGMYKKDKKSVKKIMDGLRGERYSDI